MDTVWTLAADAYFDCGPSMTREQFGVYAWCRADLEEAAWQVYKSITLN
jgi:hypothetical protein